MKQGMHMGRANPEVTMSNPSVEHSLPSVSPDQGLSSGVWNRGTKLKGFFIAFLVLAILALHYSTPRGEALHHAAYRMLFCIPLILAGFWFFFRGVVSVSITVFILYLPHAVSQWEGFSHSYNQILEGVLFFAIAFIIGHLVEKERREHRGRVETERLAAIGMAVSEIAHDMKAPLVAIGGFAGQVHRDLGEDDRTRVKIELVIRETARLQCMVKNMLEFGRPLHLQAVSGNLIEIVKECIQIMRPVARDSGIVLKEDLDPALPAFLLDGERIKEVVINLITNAIQASPRGEAVWISTCRNGSRAEVSISDHGHGIAEEDRERIFDPFFSKKKGGTGLGLSTARKIVNAHEGSVSVCQNHDKGVTFRVILPMKRE
ncbi:MAG: ATP-binding protein [Thermodesulfobacteriota bacterium]